MSLKEFMGSRFGVALSEPSTWQGFVMVASSFGYYMTTDQVNHFIGAALAIVGLLNSFLKDDVNSPHLFQNPPDSNGSDGDSGVGPTEIGSIVTITNDQGK